MPLLGWCVRPHPLGSCHGRNSGSGILTGLAFGFTAPAGYTISLTGLTLTNAAWSSGNLNECRSFTGPGKFGRDGRKLFPGSTGLSDGFTLAGSFEFSGSGGDGADTKMGYEVYAVVPEPATVAFGLALVGGPGLHEIRRRKIS